VDWEDGDEEDRVKRTHELKPIAPEASQEEEAAAAGAPKYQNIFRPDARRAWSQGPDKSAAFEGGSNDGTHKAAAKGKGSSHYPRTPNSRRWGYRLEDQHWMARVGSRVTTGVCYTGLHHVFRYPPHQVVKTLSPKTLNPKP
jgi:hypothetical protein